jgi:hypothetical protein
MSETRRLYLTTMGYIDLSEYLLKTEAETLYATIDVANNKQDKLISGTNIKTINNQSILGSGNIAIEGGGSSGGSSAYPENYLRTSSTTMSISPNVFYVWDEVPSLTLTFTEGANGVANEYLFQFTSGSTPTTLSLPDDIKWANELVIQPNKIYQVSILKGLASVLEFDNAPKLNLIENHITYDEGSFMDGGTITFEYPTASELTFAMDLYQSSTLIVPQGSTQINIDWYEPMPPSIRSISPTEDSTYKYIL